jgi:hypothetical protein
VRCVSSPRDPARRSPVRPAGHGRPGGGIDPFSGPGPAPAVRRAEPSVGRAEDPTEALFLSTTSTPEVRRPHAARQLSSAPGPAGRGGRRGPAGLLAPNQRVTEPPAGLGPPHYPAGYPARYPAPILPPLADAATLPGPWHGYGRRWWVIAAVALVAVAALGVVGSVALAHRFGAGSDGLLVKARDLSYRVPSDWRSTPGGPETTVNGVALDGVATAARYTCGGHGYYRATVGSTFLVRRDGVNARAEDAARDFGPLFASSFYGPGASTSASAPTPLTVGDVTGSTSLVTVRPAAAAGCPDLAGRLTVVALPTSRTGASGGTGVLLLVVQHDAAGGPASPAPVGDRVVSEILSSVRVAAR